MSSLLLNALRAGINHHMLRLNNEADDSDLEYDSDLGSESDFEISDSDKIVQARDLFFDEDTIQNMVENGVKARFRDAARRLMPKRRGGRCSAYRMNPGQFADQLNYDFTNILVDQQTFYRGGSQYIRPLGSMRYGLDVVGKYGDNAWLGGEHERENDCGSMDGEWPVAYHGTTDPRAAEIIASGGLDAKKGTRFLFGHGIYCTPDPKTALAYASEYKHHGKSYKLVVQARVDPAHREIVPKSEHGVPGLEDYWIVTKKDAIREYGICVFPC